MQLMSYAFTARTKREHARPLLFSSWTLAGFAVVVMIPLVMIFPKQDLLQQASQQKLGDALTISYLNNLQKADPGNLELRVLLAEHRIAIRDAEGLDELLAPVLGSESARWRAKGLLVQYKYLTLRFHESARHSILYRQLLRQRIDTLTQLHKRYWPIQTMVYLAGQADQLHERGISSLLYQRISDASETRSTGWFSIMGRQELGRGNYELAAHLYFIARRKAGTLSEQRKYLLAGVRALISGNLLTQAMRGIDRNVGNLADDSETLYALIQAARAANDQDRAVRYTKRLLHLSWKGGTDGAVLAWLQQLDLSWIGIANAAAETATTTASQKPAPYVRKNYELAYRVFLENGQLKEAFQVAETIVRHSPQEKIWHQRLAQVAEWSGNQQVALREHLWLYRHGGGREAESAVLRLASSLHDSDALLDVWQRVAARQKLDDVQWNNLENLFEKTGRQREGIKFFEQRYAADHQVWQLETAARLAERNGEDDRARDMYLRLSKRHGENAEWTKKIAHFHLRKGEYQQAYDLLHKNRGLADEKDVHYWKALADLAWQLQLDSEATESYRRMAEGGELARGDFSRLIYLLSDSKQEEKAALAELAYSRYDDRDMLLRALELYAITGNRKKQQHLFESAAKNRKLDVSGSARFYLLRGQYFHAGGDFQLARADFFRAASIAPNDANISTAFLWLLIDGNDLSGLRTAVAQVIARGDQENPAYWGVLAAAYQTLGQPARAVAYYTRQIKQSKQDFLWLVNYAEVLEQARLVGMAARVRRHAWLQARDLLHRNHPGRLYSQEMLVAARLAIENDPGDAASSLMREVLRQDRLLAQDEVVSRNVGDLSLGWALSLNARDDEMERRVNDLVLGWAVSQERASNAKAWLWQRYARSLNRPLWASSTVALADKNVEQLSALLDRQGNGLTMLTRHDVANAVGRPGEAQSIIYQGLADDPQSDEAHQRLSEDMLAAATELNVGWREEKTGSLHRLVQEVRVEMPVSSALRVGAEYWKARQSNNELSALGDIPSLERVTGLRLKHHGKLGDTEVVMRRRQEYSNTVESHVIHDMSIAPRLQLHFGAEFNAVANESNELQVFGMRNQTSLRLFYTLSQREYMQVESAWSRYRTQTGSDLGSGKYLSWEFGYKVRTGYPDLNVRVNGLHTRLSGIQNAVLDLASDADTYGVCGGFGGGVQFAYTRAWRPSLDYCATYNSVSGQGYNAALGLAGAVAGHDQLSLALRQTRGGANLINGLSQELSMNYRIYFD
ncbi:MAG: tetratricopeptide repeat protein [Pseudomonadota bacterium]